MRNDYWLENRRSERYSWSSDIPTTTVRTGPARHHRGRPAPQRVGAPPPPQETRRTGPPRRPQPRPGRRRRQPHRTARAAGHQRGCRRGDRCRWRRHRLVPGAPGGSGRRSRRRGDHRRVRRRVEPCRHTRHRQPDRRAARTRPDGHRPAGSARAASGYTGSGTDDATARSRARRQRRRSSRTGGRAPLAHKAPRTTTGRRGHDTARGTSPDRRAPRAADNPNVPDAGADHTAGPEPHDNQPVPARPQPPPGRGAVSPLTVAWAGRSPGHAATVLVKLRGGGVFSAFPLTPRSARRPPGPRSSSDPATGPGRSA